MSDSEPALSATDLVVERGDERVLDGVSLGVAPGERVLVRGASGVGKTTLFHALGLLDRPTAGRIEIDGRDVSGLSERQRARLRRDALGIVFQEFRLIPDLTAWENAAVPQDHTGERDPAWLEPLFEALDLHAQRDQYPASLSGGEKRRVAIARALANRPSVVLADEPTGQLDPDAADRVLDLLFDTRSLSESALLVVSHDPTLADRFDTVFRLDDGRLDGAIDETPGSEAGDRGS
jgi:putative ABC transport system ATP-binding protein